MARRRKGRPLNGILVLDKPTGMSSNAALQTARRLFDAQKAGHTGALDPLASGVLPICFGEATKFSQYLLDADKAYHSVFRLGIRTASGDAEGEELSRCDASHITRAMVDAEVPAFRGEITQVPSMYSALKHQGQPLYKLARKGIEVERKSRHVTIHTLHVGEFIAGEHPSLAVDVRCSKGTYIRSIAEDLGESLGVGGHVEVLRRTEAGPFHLHQAITLEQLREQLDQHGLDALDEHLLPVETPVMHFPAVTINNDLGRYFLQGQPVMKTGLPDGLLRVYVDTMGFVGLGECNDDAMLAPRRLFQSHT
ncbi:MAG TPA: tRNA pseudouridine(55) synthase TruB [Pseudomonadales bacterium]|nr:tRNA pseudouridine(55) synthase TruB [Pseudomonadales bacterium]